MLIAQTTNLGTLQPASSVLTTQDLSNTGATPKLEAVISEFFGIITVVGGILLLFYFVIGALNWISAAGDAGKIQKARDQMIQAVGGMVMLVAAYGVIGLIGNFLGLHLLNPGTAFLNIVKQDHTIN